MSDTCNLYLYVSLSSSDTRRILRSCDSCYIRFPNLPTSEGNRSARKVNLWPRH